MQVDQPKIVVLGTGGTIAGRAASPQDNLGYTAAQVGVAELLQGLPALAGRELVAEQVAQVDSKDMDFAVLRRLALRCAHWLAQAGVQGIVITHGTDTLEETAWFLQTVLAPAKPVVLTCAMRPATSQSPDGPQNVADALAVACTPGAQGVVAVCAGTVHGAREVQKVHTYRLDAFSSGDAGPIGYVEEGALRRLRGWPDAQDGAAALLERLRQRTELDDPAAWPRVEIVLNYAGAGGAIVDALAAQGVKGIVVAGTGNGTLHKDLEAALLRHQARGLRVVRATRCAGGVVLSAEGSAIADSEGLSAVKARVGMVLLVIGRDT